MTYSREQNKIMETKAKTIQMYELPNNNLITVIKMFNNLKRLQIKKKLQPEKQSMNQMRKPKKKKKKIRRIN